MVAFIHLAQKSLAAFAVMGVVSFSTPAQADLLTNLGTALNSSLSQSTQNMQSGVQSGVQNTIQSNIAHPNEVNAAKNVAGNATVALNPKTMCSQIPAELQTKYTKVCASFDANNPCSALPASGLVSKEQGKLQSLCNARQSLAAMQGQAAAKVMPSAGAVSTNVSQQLQNQLNTLMTRH